MLKYKNDMKLKALKHEEFSKKILFFVNIYKNKI